jgi:thiol peroxidase
MARVTCLGETLYTDGSFPQIGKTISPLYLTDSNWEDVCINEFKCQFKVLDFYPSIDSPRAVQHAGQLQRASHGIRGAKCFVISSDLPCALQKWRLTEGIQNMDILSAFRSQKFLLSHGLMISSGRFKGLGARAVMVLDAMNKVIYAKLAADLMDGPDLSGLSKAMSLHLNAEMV